MIKRLCLFIFISSLCLNSFAETKYSTFDGGLRIQEPFQLDCDIQDSKYVLFVDAGESNLKVLKDGEWVIPYEVRFSPSSLTIVIINETGSGYGFALGEVVLNYELGPIRVIYRNFVPGQTKGNPYVISDKNTCKFI